VAITAAAPAAAPQGDVLAHVRNLYQSALYEDALIELGKLPAGDAPVARVEEYRTFCLLALGRTDEASQSVVRVVTADPLLVPASADASPRVLSFFTEARQKVVPGLARSVYANGRTAMTAGDFHAAAAAFTQTVSLIDSLAPGNDDLKDLRLLAAGFAELALQRAAPAAAPAATPPGAPTTAANPSTDLPVSAAAPPHTAPVAISQVFPVWRGAELDVPRTGVVHVFISDAGLVTAVEMEKSIEGIYDQQVLAAARTWRYKPATLRGRPIASDKEIAFTVGRPNR
jgi:hypothetical protein